MNTYFISDTHFGHENIIKYCSRPFKDVYDMNTTLINNWNARVRKEDKVYFLGDFNFKRSAEAITGNKPDSYRSKLNGEIIFIIGNHDKHNGIKNGIHSLVLIINKTEVQLIHDPKNIREYYPINLCGHVHNSWRFKKINQNLLINVSADVQNFYPKTLNEILLEYRKWEKKINYLKVSN